MFNIRQFSQISQFLQYTIFSTIGLHEFIGTAFLHLNNKRQSSRSMAEAILRNRFLGSLNVYKYGLSSLIFPNILDGPVLYTILSLRFLAFATFIAVLKALFLTLLRQLLHCQIPDTQHHWLNNKLSVRLNEWYTTLHSIYVNSTPKAAVKEFTPSNIYWDTYGGRM